MFAPSRRLSAALTAAALVVSYAVAAVATSGPAAAEGTVTVTIQGRGTVTASGISCSESGGDCSQFYPDQIVCPRGSGPQLPPPGCEADPQDIELTAAADRDGYVLDHFDGCDNASGRTCDVFVGDDRNITAVFRDVQPPTATLTTPSNGSFLSGNMVAAATATDNGTVSRVEFLVRGVVVASDVTPPYAMNFDTTTIADGPAAVAARAVDSVGQVSASSVATVTVDNTAPALTVTGPDSQTFGPGSTQTWTISASDAISGLKSVQCSLVATTSAPSFGPCSAGPSGHSVSGLPQGGYTLTVQATDNANRTSSASRHFTIDATPPDTTVTSGPANGAVVASRTVTFGLGASEAGSLTCRLYGSGTTAPAFAPCTSGSSFIASGLNDGSYVFEARAVDTVGNVDGSPASRTFTVDATPPAVSFAKQPPRTVKTTKRKAKVAFAFSSEAGASLRCSLDGAAYAACPATLTLKVKAGRHTLSVEAVDAAGNVSAPATAAWKVKRVHKHR